MSKLIIGVGGTGAKVVESFIHLCGAGLGPAEDVTVAWIDQDVANGNTERARTTLQDYMLARRILRDNADHGIPASMTCDLLRTDLTPLGGDIESDYCLWVPHRESNTTLAEIICYNLIKPVSVKNLARVLFASGKTELDMELNEGYRGRPHVGSAAFLVSLKGNRSWELLRKNIEDAYEGDARVFLCGSVFGGTGAAIFPTLARRVREDGKQGLRIGGALMLPYFTFRSPDDDETANVALSNQMLLQSRFALEYYDSLLGTRVFDELYLLGWREPFALPYHAAGARGQRNPPLVPELLAALAAARFFRTPAQDAPAATVYHCHARSVGDTFAWHDLPEVVEDERRVADVYASWLRFCALWCFDYGKAIRLGRARDIREPWRRRILGDAFFNGDGAEAARHVHGYVDTFLQYAAAMSAFSQTKSPGGATFDLWAHEPIAAVAQDTPTGLPNLDSGTLASDLETLDRLVPGDNLPGAHDIYWKLNQIRPNKAGLGALVAAIHECV